MKHVYVVVEVGLGGDQAFLGVAKMRNRLSMKGISTITSVLRS